MQKYRVWEANRKVFLYPENWIKSELRDDKSPIYKEFESELLQSETNPDVVDHSIKSYLTKLDAISNLETVGVHYEEDRQSPSDSDKREEVKRVHVIARTRNTPHNYFYRHLDQLSGDWTPWEAVPVDIPTYDDQTLSGRSSEIGAVVANALLKKSPYSGTYVTPVVFNSRLLIFFPQIEKKALEQEPASDENFRVMGGKNVSERTVKDYLEVKLAWSELNDGKWSTKQVSTGSFRLDRPDSHRLSFVPRVFNQHLLICVYGHDKKPKGGFILRGQVFEAVGEPEVRALTNANHVNRNAKYHSRLNNRIHSYQAIKKGHPHRLDSEPFIVDSDRNNTKFEEAAKGSSITLPKIGRDLTPKKQPFWHPFTGDLISIANFSDMSIVFDGLNDTSRENPFGEHTDKFGETTFHELKHPYAVYNWELGFHAPMFLVDLSLIHI